MSKIKILGIIVLLAFVVYFNGLFNEFIGDDKEQILNNPYVHSINSIPTLFSYGIKSSGNGIANIYYKPLMPIAFNLMYSISGPNPFFFHLFQLLIHVANAFVVFLIFKRFFSKNISFFLSLFFLLHPINQEAVQSISSYQDVLFFFFGGGALLLIIYSKFDLVKKISFSFLLFFALLSKESGVLFFPIILIFSYLCKKEYFKTLLFLETAVLFIYLVLRSSMVSVFTSKIEDAPIMNLDLSERLINTPKIIFYYFKTIVLPIDLSFSQQWIVKSASIEDFFIPAILILLIFCFVFFFYLKLKLKRVFIFFLIWLVIGFLPNLHIIPLDMTVANRWTYFPMVGVLGIVGVGLEKVLTKKREKIAYLILIFLLFIFSIRVIVRNMDWKNAYALFSHDSTSAKSYIVENNLGDELFKLEKKEEARIRFEKALKMNPKWWIAWNNLGIYYDDRGDHKKAEKYYKKSLEGNYPPAYENLARNYLLQKKYDLGKSFIKKALKKNPKSPSLWATLGIIEYKLGDKKEALFAVKKSFELFPTQSTKDLYDAIKKNLDIE